MCDSTLDSEFSAFLQTDTIKCMLCSKLIAPLWIFRYRFAKRQCTWYLFVWRHFSTCLSSICTYYLLFVTYVVTFLLTFYEVNTHAYSQLDHVLMLQQGQPVIVRISSRSVSTLVKINHLLKINKWTLQPLTYLQDHEWTRMRAAWQWLNLQAINERLRRYFHHTPSIMGKLHFWHKVSIQEIHHPFNCDRYYCNKSCWNSWKMVLLRPQSL